MQTELEEEKSKYEIKQSANLENSDMLIATNLWCDITNALIMKYKHLSEDNPMRAIRELSIIQTFLIKEGILNENEIGR